MIRVGDKAVRNFVVDEGAMQWFQRVSEDTSRIHCDPDFAHARGYEGVIVYGGVMLAHLSHLLGTAIPGQRGMSISWSIKYRDPLYVGESAIIEIEVVDVSPGTGVVESKFRVVAGEKLVANGKVQSIVPVEDLV